MSIEQTNQLILLILNSVLMALLTAGLAGGAWLRQQSLAVQLQQVKAHHRQLTRMDAANYPANHKSDLRIVRDRRQQLTHQSRWNYAGTCILHLSLLGFCTSVLALAVRSLLPFDLLITLALALFSLGAVALLIGIFCFLIDFAQGSAQGQSLLQTLGLLLMQIISPMRRFQISKRRLWARKSLGRPAISSVPGAPSRPIKAD